MFLPDPLVVRTPGEPEQQQDANHSLKPWSVQRNFESIAQRFPLGPADLHFGGVVTSLPTGVPAGHIVMYNTGSTDVIWMLRYNGTDWNFLGGPPLRAAVETVEGRANTAYGALATAGPSITLPALAGSFDVAHGCRLIATTATAHEGFMSYSIAGGAASDANACSGVSSGVSDGACVVMRRRLTGLAASSSFVSQYRTQTANNYDFSKRWLEITPHRVS